MKSPQSSVRVMPSQPKGSILVGGKRIKIGPSAIPSIPGSSPQTILRALKKAIQNEIFNPTALKADG